jgi:flagellin
MGMVLNTNIGALQAQRALSESRGEMEKAMERLATGSRINSAADDAAGLAMVERMNSQIRGLTMATKNANDGIALIKTAENAMVEVSGMLQRMRELAVQAANATASDTERAFANNEINQLQQEVSRVSANTRYNGTQILNGTFSAKTLQIGIMSGEDIAFTIDSIEAALLGVFEMTSRVLRPNGISASTYANSTNAVDSDDITIVANGNSRTVTIDAAETAKSAATKINAVAGATTVLAQARTTATLRSSSETDLTYTIKINDTETAAFTLSSAGVTDAVTKINAITSSTGVMAAATTDGRVRLIDSDGDDITIENTSSQTTLFVDALENDGLTPAAGGGEDNLAATGVSAKDLTTIAGTIRLTSTSGFTVNQATSTTSAKEKSTTANLITAIAAATAGATYNLSFMGTSLDFTLEDSGDTAGKISGSGGNSPTAATIAADIQNHSGYAAADFTVEASATTGVIVLTAKQNGAGAAATTTIGGATATATQTTAGGGGNSFFTDGEASAALGSIADIAITTTIGATNALAILDGALDTVSGMRGSLGTLQNRLDYSVSNLMKVTEYTTGARSRIADADFAAETSRLAKAQVLQQAGASMLAQANASTDTVLQLLRG